MPRRSRRSANALGSTGTALDLGNTPRTVRCLMAAAWPSNWRSALEGRRGVLGRNRLACHIGVALVPHKLRLRNAPTRVLECPRGAFSTKDGRLELRGRFVLRRCGILDGRGPHASLSVSPVSPASLHWPRRKLQLDLGSQFDDALRRNLEVIRRAHGVAPHESVELFAPHGQFGPDCRDGGFPTQEE